MSFAIIFSTTSFAASPVGWSVSPLDILMNGATATITAVKGTGASALQSTIKHAPTAVNVGKKLLKGTGYAAVGLAVTQLVGDSVDWVLDPANNAVKYSTPAVVDPTSKFCPVNGNYMTPTEGIAYCNNYFGVNSCAYSAQKNAITLNGGAVWGCNKPPLPTSPEYAYIPIETVANQLIANAAAGDVASQDAVKAAAIDDVNAGSLDVPLNLAAVPVADAPPIPVDPVDPAAPPAPFDPSSIIAAIKSVMAAIVNMAGMIGSKFDELIANDNVHAKAEADVAAQEKIDRDAKAKADKEFTDWVQTPPKEDAQDTTVAIPDDTVLPADTDINFGGSCPANFEINSSIFGNPVNIVLLDTAKFCGFLATFVKYPVYAVSSLYALYILGGRKDV